MTVFFVECWRIKISLAIGAGWVTIYHLHWLGFWQDLVAESESSKEYFQLQNQHRKT